MSEITVVIVIFCIFRVFWIICSDNDTKVEPDKAKYRINEKNLLTPKKELSMSTKVVGLRERVSSILKNLGFIIGVDNDKIYFSFEGINMLIIITEDQSYLGILVPNIIDMSDENELLSLRIVESLNNRVKYVKAYIPYDNSIWLSYERELMEEEIEEELVGSMISNLEYACHEIWNYYNVIKNNTDGKD